MLPDLLKTLQQTDARPPAKPDIRVTFFEGIDLTEMEWVHAKLLAEFLYRRFQCEVRLRTSRSTIGAGSWFVGLNHIALNIHIGAAVDPGEMEATEACKRIGIGSRIKNHPGLDGSERAVPLRTQFDG